MKNRFALSVLLLTLATFVSGEENRRVKEPYESTDREGAAVMTPDLLRGKFQDVLAAGVLPIIEEAVQAEDEVTDPAGNQVLSRATVIPFVDSATGKRGYFMTVSVRSPEGNRLFSHDLTVFDRECTCLSENVEPAIPSEPPRWQVESQSISSDARMLRDWIKARKWSSIDNWVKQQLKKGAKKATINAIVKKAFELTGHKCPDLKWYVPFKSYIYMLTCWKSAE